MKIKDIDDKTLIYWVISDILAKEFLQVVNDESTIFHTNLNSAKSNVDKRHAIRNWIAVLQEGIRLIVGPPALSKNANQQDVINILDDLNKREQGGRAILATY